MLKLHIRDKVYTLSQLDDTGQVPNTQLPAYVDDVREFADQASFPAEGDAGIIYVALDTNQLYRWSGSTYINLSGAGGSGSGPETTDELAEGATNLYFTDTRAQTAVRETLEAMGFSDASGSWTLDQGSIG